MRHYTRYKFVYLSSFESLKDSTCILLLKENKNIYVDNVLEIGRLAKILAWQAHSNSNIDDIKLSREDFRSILNDRIKNRNISLVNIYTRDIDSLISIMPSGIEQIYVIHAACTSCELRKLLLNLIEMQRRNDILVIFSVRSNSYELLALLNSWKAHLSAYIDYFDALGLINTETSDEYSLISFNRREIL